MRILHTADIHANHEWFEWIANNCMAFDLLVIAGDLLNLFSNIRQHDQAKAVRSWLSALKAQTIVCTGNHDHWVAPHGIIDTAAEGRWLASLNGHGNIVATDGNSVRLNEVTFVVNGWGQRPTSGGDILVTHAPPAGNPCATSNGYDFGDPELLYTTGQRPKLILAGHVHHPVAYSTRLSDDLVVLVSGQDDHSPIPSHWLINTDRGMAAHSSGAIVHFQAIPST